MVVSGFMCGQTLSKTAQIGNSFVFYDYACRIYNVSMQFKQSADLRKWAYI